MTGDKEKTKNSTEDKAVRDHVKNLKNNTKLIGLGFCNSLSKCMW
jgi:hypothetical protein